MLKVGIYLRAREEMGGTLQYNLGVLAAARLLPRERYQVVVASSGDYWQQRLQGSGFTHVRLGNTLVSRASAELWGRLRLAGIRVACAGTVNVYELHIQKLRRTSFRSCAETRRKVEPGRRSQIPGRLRHRPCASMHAASIHP